MDIGAPPFSSMSALVNMAPSICTKLLNSRACSIQSLPVMDSPTNILRSGLVVLIIFSSSAMRLVLE